MEIDPFKSFVGIVAIPERGLAFVNVVEMLNEPAETVVFRQSRKLPIELAVVVPFAALTEFAAHEKQLLARMPVHPGEKHPQIRELLPFIARHLIEKRTLAVDDLVVAEHENEMLRERVHEREGDAVVMEAAKDRIERHVMKEVVHPTHVPFEAESEAAEIGRLSNAGPGSGFLGDRHDAGETLVANFVEAFQEINGVEIFAATERVRDPLAGFARVIEVKHRGDRVHTQAVDVIFVEPEKRVADEEIAHFVAAEIKNQRAPVLVLALARVRMLVEIRAVEFRQPMRVLWEVGWYPVHNHPDAFAVARIHKMHEFLRSAESRRGSEVPDDLITPRA